MLVRRVQGWPPPRRRSSSPKLERGASRDARSARSSARSARPQVVAPDLHGNSRESAHLLVGSRSPRPQESPLERQTRHSHRAHIPARSHHARSLRAVQPQQRSPQWRVRFSPSADRDPLQSSALRPKRSLLAERSARDALLGLRESRERSVAAYLDHQGRGEDRWSARHSPQRRRRVQQGAHRAHAHHLAPGDCRDGGDHPPQHGALGAALAALGRFRFQLLH